MIKGYTPHINASAEDFAQTVLMPGDPKRSEYIANNFLSDIRLVNDVRGVKGYTGLYKGQKVSVMASGMGMPSMAIYSYELFNFFDVENIIRVGSAGAYQKDINLRDIVIAAGACTDSNYASHFNLNGTFAPIANFELLTKAVTAAKNSGACYHIGNVVSSDCFYSDFEGLPDYKKPLNAWGKMGVLAVEMEAAALYMNAAMSGKKGLAICTVSDSLVTGEALSAEEREKSFNQMIKIALETAI